MGGLWSNVLDISCIIPLHNVKEELCLKEKEKKTGQDGLS